MASTATEQNEHHSSQLVSYMRFAKYQRGQCIKSIKSAVQDTKETRLMDDTFTLEEVEEVIEAVTEAVTNEVETELINSAHTNVLLLQQLFGQGEKWHLNLDTDLSELENRELLAAVRKWEENELAGTKVEKPLVEKKKLAPLNDGGPTQLLNLQIQKLEQENQGLRQRMKTIESQATEILESKLELKAEVESLKIQKTIEVETEIKTGENTKEFEKLAEQKEEVISELSEAVDAAKQELMTEKQISEKSQKELENDLMSAKHRFLEVQHQLNMAEKELEKKFSETGAYKNLKKMLGSKNATIKEMRNKLNVYEPNTVEDDEREEE
eukprot:TRINITY_DN15044_c0_g1_i2.p1 TRINITY_DN15044_c0_g1~~TRINITY_DN15044_c0_g1_i2.p1  ORF type:complete len:326 (-),score=127.84 TRINITY_DN15044_c0_g1_i2:113-1090(-)